MVGVPGAPAGFGSGGGGEGRVEGGVCLERGLGMSKGERRGGEGYLVEVARGVVDVDVVLDWGMVIFSGDPVWPGGPVDAESCCEREECEKEEEESFHGCRYCSVVAKWGEKGGWRRVLRESILVESDVRPRRLGG